MTWGWRILFQPFFFLPERWNGMDEHLLLLARYLSSRQFELLVLGHPSDGPQTRLLAERAGLRYLEAPYGPGASWPVRCARLRALYKRERIDILHMHSPV